jgi:hypothetical protein
MDATVHVLDVKMKDPDISVGDDSLQALKYADITS